MPCFDSNLSQNFSPTTHSRPSFMTHDHHHHHHDHGLHSISLVSVNMHMTPIYTYRYCSNYYGESPDPVEQCDWCQIEERSRSSKHINRIWSKSKSTVSLDKMNTKSEFSGDMNVKRKEERDDETTQKGKSTNGTPSPRPTTRRYKLLKDVMC